MKTKKIIIDLKYKSYLLFKDSMIPSQLYDYISKLGIYDSIGYVKFLMFLSEQTIRIKGYYKKYPDIHKDMNTYVVNQVFEYLTKNN